MSFEVIATPRFRKDIKKLAKKYISLKNEFSLLLDNLASDPRQGTSIGNECYKIRLAIASKGKGKSGGARIITNIVVSGSIVYLLTIYDKSEKENVSDKELKELLAQLSEE
jgi:mRNA-degrading endonuclease RelE of RelBE toxin-antitoxin system